MLERQPIAVTGGEVLARLVSREGDTFPPTASVVLDNETRLEGRILIASPEPHPGARVRAWPELPIRVSVRYADEQPLGPDEAASIWIDVPDGYRGELRIDRDTIRPRWLDPAPPPNGDVVLPLTRSLDRPDPDSPFEYWRWAVIAYREGRIPDTPHFDQAVQSVARYSASVWRAALARIDRASHGVAEECIDLLTMTAVDPRGSVRFASWLTEPGDLLPLLELGANLKLEGDALADAALAWARSRRTDLAFVNRVSPSSAVFAVIRPALGNSVAKAVWQRPSSIPVASPLAGATLNRFMLRVDEPRDEPIRTPAGWLEPLISAVLQVDSATIRLAVPPAQIWAKPPGVALPEFVPLLTLADLRSGLQPMVPADRATTAVLRRAAGRWELYVECMRPPSARHFEGEGIEVYVGGPAQDAAGIVLKIAEAGRAQVVRSATPPDLDVRQSSFGDRWRVGVILPGDWLPAAPIDAVTIGLLRRHGDTGAVETSGVPCLPWDVEPSRLSVRLETWDGAVPLRD